MNKPTEEPAATQPPSPGAPLMAEARPMTIQTHSDLPAERICAALAVGMTHLDDLGRILQADTIFCAMMGWDAGDVAGRLFVDLVHPEDRDRVEQQLNGVRPRTVHGATGEFRLICGDGGTLWVRVTVLPLATADEHGLVGLVQNIQAQKAAEEALETARAALSAHQDLEEQKDAFLSAVAHDLRTPLTTIKGRVQMLRRMLDRQGTVDLERIANGLERIDGSSWRLITLIDELLEVANIQIGRPLQVTRSQVDLVTLAHGSIAGYRDMADNHRFRIDADGAPIIGSWDERRLGRALANLLSNAVKYSPDGGEITVTVTAEDDEAVLCVADEGIGIPTEDIPHIFDRFHRGRNTRGNIPGTGIGLAAVREIVHEHGGTIEVESDLGRGTTFTIRVPRAEEEPASE